MLDGTVWTFIANIEDYKDKNKNNVLPIQSFIKIILEKIVTDVVLLEEWYGDKDSPIQYVLTNTKIKCKNSKERFYNGNYSRHHFKARLDFTMLG